MTTLQLIEALCAMVEDDPRRAFQRVIFLDEANPPRYIGKVGYAFMADPNRNFVGLMPTVFNPDDFPLVGVN